MTAWPAWLGRSDEHGTCYVDPAVIASEVQRRRTGQAWKFHELWTTYCPDRKITYKSLQRLRPESESDFWKLMGACEQAGLDPPTSVVDLFLSLYRNPMPRASVIAPFHGKTFGGWQTARWHGTYAGKVWHYDLNKAYRWAACQGLPNLDTAYITTRWDEPWAIYSVRLRRTLPYQQYEGFTILTTEERDQLKIARSSVDVLAGIGFTDERIDLTPTFQQCDRDFPEFSARISRAFWGLWNCCGGLTRHTYKSFRIIEQKNPWYNPIWAAFVTSRIKLRMAAVAMLALHIFVDSVLLVDILDAGISPGQWRLVEEFPRGVWIKHPGHWGTGPLVVKQSGRRK